MKYFLLLSILFLLAFCVRTVAFFDIVEKPGRQVHAYQMIGTGSDQDYQMKCASLWAQNLSSEVLTHYDYLFMCPFMGIFFRHFNFIPSLILINGILLLSGCIVAIFPFLLLSTKKMISKGGIIASLLLIFNPVMIENTSGRFFIYPLVSFIYILVIFVLFKAINTKKLSWILSFGIISAIQSLNKPFLFVNDIPFILIFFFIMLIEQFEIKNAFPFIKISFNKSAGMKSAYAIFTYFFITISYEVFHHEVTGGFSFLTDLFLPTNGPSTKDFVLSASLKFEGPFLQKIHNIYNLLFLATYQTVKYFHFSLIIPIVTTFFILSKRRPKKWFLLSMILTLIFFMLLYLTRFQLLFNNKYVAIPPLRKEIFAVLSSFISLLFILTFSSKKEFSLNTSHIFYFGALAMTLAAVQQNQLFVTNIIWIALLIGVILENGFKVFFSRFTSRVQNIVFILVLSIFSFSFYDSSLATIKTLTQIQNEIHYLKWVTTLVPENGYILGGTDNLILTSIITKKTILNNAFFVASRIEPDHKIWENSEFSSFPQFIKNQMNNKATNQSLIVMDHNVAKWQQYLMTGASETYPANKYFLKEIGNSNNYLNRKVYVLTNNPNYVEPNLQTQ